MGSEPPAKIHGTHPIFVLIAGTERLYSWLVNQPPHPWRTPARNKGLIAGLMKGNPWFISPDHKGPRLFLRGFSNSWLNPGESRDPYLPSRKRRKHIPPSEKGKSSSSNMPKPGWYVSSLKGLSWLFYSLYTTWQYHSLYTTRIAKVLVTAQVW